MNDLTTREVSQRLMGVGFEAEPSDHYDIDMMDNVIEGIGFVGKLPAYSASTLLTWMQDNLEHEDRSFIIYHDSIEIADRDTWEMEYLKVARFEYNGSWPDLLAEAIIFILNQEKEIK